MRPWLVCSLVIGLLGPIALAGDGKAKPQGKAVPAVATEFATDEPLPPPAAAPTPAPPAAPVVGSTPCVNISDPGALPAPAPALLLDHGYRANSPRKSHRDVDCIGCYKFSCEWRFLYGGCRAFFNEGKFMPTVAASELHPDHPLLDGLDKLWKDGKKEKRKDGRACNCDK